jgi:3-deoxy-D-manno-octulosonate 8-phosphate phosphatase (KDO 8-P phosphatase)
MNEKKISPRVLECIPKIKLLLMDCDGVLTDGKLYFSKDGEELKVFHVHDGQGIVNWHKAGFLTGIITGRKSEILKRRVEELGIHYLIQNSKDKTKDFKEILAVSGVSADEVAYVGDDLADLELLKLVKLPIAVANCAEELKASVLHITNKNGGMGAIREITDLLLKKNTKKS